MFDKLWKVGLLVVLAAGVGVVAFLGRYEVVHVRGELSLEYDHWTGRAGLLIIADEEEVRKRPQDFVGSDVYHVDALRVWVAERAAARR
jgi:hypothetical protein